MVDESHAKGQATRERNAAARARLWEEQAELLAVAKEGLRRVLEREDATPEQVLEASRLLVQLGK